MKSLGVISNLSSGIVVYVAMIGIDPYDAIMGIDPYDVMMGTVPAESKDVKAL